MAGKLDGRVVLVTGAGRGIGAAIAVKLAEAGATVVASDADSDRAEAVVGKIQEQGGKAYAFRLDITSEQNWADAIGHVSERSGQLDILVNNAGITIAKSVEDTSLEEWRRIMTVNLEGAFIGVKAALPLMRDSAKKTPYGGSIVNMGSISGIVGTATLAAYTASKGGVRFFSKSIAIDFARRGYRIRVNSVHPGLTEGESAQVLFESRIRTGLSKTLDEAKAAWLSNYPLGRIGRQEDIAAGVLYLASDDSSFVTGTELVIDGGLSAG